MKFLIVPVLAVISLVPGVSFALPNDHSHKMPSDFTVTCKTIGTVHHDRRSSTTVMIWDSKDMKMTIAGDGLGGDRASLNLRDGYASKRTIKAVSAFFKGGSGLKRLYMTFREDFEPRPDTYHGGDWANIRTFKFNIRDGEPGSVFATEVAYIEGILSFDDEQAVLDECTYTGIYAAP